MRGLALKPGGNDITQICHRLRDRRDRPFSLARERAGDRGVLLDDVPAVVAGGLEGFDDGADRDIALAEPGAVIGFAGARVIEETIREKLPPGFQRAEYLEEHGMVDMVVHRHQMRDSLSRMVRMLMKAPSREVPSTALVPAGG